jgi:hypothetical protein
MISIREQEKKCFAQAFRVYIIPFVRKLENKQVILRKDTSDTVFFEFTEDNGVKTIRKFEEDLIFAYNIAVDAIYEMTRKDEKLQIAAYENYAVVNILD